MKRSMLSLLCVLALLLSLLPMSAAADNAIDKVLCTLSSVPVAMNDSRDIYANTSTANCYIEDYYWRRPSDGYMVYQLFGTETVEVTITLRAYDGWYFSDSVAVYLNNSSVFYSLGEGGKTLSLTRSYTPELWAPNVIKHPGNETVEEGEFASFVASATVTEKYIWYLYDPNEDKSYPAYEVSSLFEGVSMQETTEGKCNFYNVTAAMDGWQVYCVFSGPGGEVKSQKASIKVKYETPPPTETPEPTPEPTEAPESSESPAPSEEPEQTPPPPDHAHTFTAQWRQSEALHWRECECGAKTDEAVHSLVWEEKREPSKREPGLRVGTCQTCGYVSEKETEYDSSSSILRYIILGLGGLVLLTILILVVDSIAASRRRRRRRKKRRR